jgi:hypothetical protein
MNVGTSEGDGEGDGGSDRRGDKDGEYDRSYVHLSNEVDIHLSGILFQLEQHLRREQGKKG